MQSPTSRFLMRLIALIFIHTAMADDNQYFISLENNPFTTDNDKLLESFYQPIPFNKEGFALFLKETFNRDLYAKEFMPYSMHTHVEQFLRWAHQSGQPSTNAAASLRLFTNRMKAAPYMTVTPLISITQHLPASLNGYFGDAPGSVFSSLKRLLKRLMFRAFNTHFEFFRSEPGQFFDTLSTDILHEIQASDLMQHEIDKEQLRFIVIRFLEIGISKLIWSPLDQEDVWHSFKRLSGALAQLEQNGIIIHDDLNDLLTSLVERLVYFFEITGSDLSPETLAMIEQDLQSDLLTINNVAEQEEFLTRKSERIADAVKATRAKLIARTQGLITEVLPA
jgi:hypothetical protein